MIGSRFYSILAADEWDFEYHLYFCDSDADSYQIKTIRLHRKNLVKFSAHFVMCTVRYGGMNV